MDRRKFLKSAGVAAGGALAAEGLAPHPAAATEGGPVPGPQPNILFILVDELRYPCVFPEGVTDAGQFLARFMPNVYRLWQKGVKFGSHYTAASACSPARGVLISGLYSQQSWLLQTIKNSFIGNASPTPPLNPAYPTYGKLLRRAGYSTPYIGKWHASIPTKRPTRLEIYGFEGLTYPDPDGSNLQGTVGDPPNGYLNDQNITDQAVEYLSARRPGEQPWCLTVGLVNPHDQQFFWAGTEFQTYNAMFPDGTSPQPILKYSTPDDPPDVPWDANPLKTVPPTGMPVLPRNWESGGQLQANKPSLQYFARTFSAAVWGGVADEPRQTGFSMQNYPGLAGTAIGLAPFRYWQRALDSYNQVMSIVDQRIGEILAALPHDVAENTVIIFGSDHGEYAGAHGFVAGKVGSGYEEPFHIPLIVVDPSHRFTGEVETIRTGLTSSVDMLTFLVGLGNLGSRDWMTGQLQQIYGGRHDMLAMLRSTRAPGRDHVLIATDELVPGFYNFNDAPLHVLGIRTPDSKLVTYAKWNPVTGAIRPETLQTEFYDYGTPDGLLELTSTPDDPRAAALQSLLFDRLYEEEFRAPLPGALGAAQTVSKDLYLLLQAALMNLPADGFTGADLRRLLSFGGAF
ncbi:sulfatase-like hydrolase/transferase [Paracraurococcus lichenis]|uniref:Sulfatase-like hydrolase/transferase n=1 Tax=Paracraurococcus lichenis TaxID=3064888 RepID=A0ABT9E200_9PROT|nr:sulfatase-like hydrolase/transferase [Paracraurococcus sp. LOR1-02]MDO9710135.1 sulfatase-like hydrolase/transferase [Paracraurococcus sp. LOR1-02]